VKCLGWAALLVMIAWVGTANAEGPSDFARAEKSFQQALAYEQAGAFDKALGELVEASELGLRRTSLFLYHLGHCHAYVGMLVEARDELTQAVHQAESEGQREVAAKARVELRGAEAGVASLTLTPPAQGAIAELTVDHTPAMTKIGARMELNPGLHQVHVVFAHRVPEDLSVSLARGEQKTMAMPEPGPEIMVTAPVVVAPAPIVRAQRRSYRTLGWVLAFGGAAMAIGGGVLWGLRDSAVNTLTPACGPTMHLCPPPDQSVIVRGRAFDDAGVTLMIVGSAALVFGVGLVRYGGPQAANFRLTPFMSTNGGGLGLSGALR
jgi:hypothetical protein